MQPIFLMKFAMVESKEKLQLPPPNRWALVILIYHHILAK